MKQGVTIFFPSRFTAKQAIAALNTSFPEAPGHFSAIPGERLVFHFTDAPSPVKGMGYELHPLPEAPPYTKEQMMAPGSCIMP